MQEQYDYLKISELDEDEIELLCTLIDSLNYWQIKDSQLSELHATASIRSQPMRTYEQTGNIRDHEGAYIPEYLANVYRQNKRSWKLLRQRLEKFGNDSGMFDKIGVGEITKVHFKFNSKSLKTELGNSQAILLTWGME